MPVRLSVCRTRRLLVAHRAAEIFPTRFLRRVASAAKTVAGMSKGKIPLVVFFVDVCHAP